MLRLPRKWKVNVAECHACHANGTSSPSATPATNCAVRKFYMKDGVFVYIYISVCVCAKVPCADIVCERWCVTKLHVTKLCVKDSVTKLRVTKLCVKDGVTSCV